MPGQRSDAGLAFDVALGIVGAAVDAGLALGRATAAWPARHAPAGWRPAFIPTRWQPASVLSDLARRGAAHRVRVAHGVEQRLDQWVPVIAERVVSRLDLAGLVTRHVDIDGVVKAVDLDAVIDRIDIVAMVDEVIAAIDLPAIIRDSTGSMASETVRGARMAGISADEAISRGLQRSFLRRRSPAPTVDPL